MELLLLYAVVLPCVAAAVLYLLRRFPAPRTPLAALLAAGASFAAALSVTLLVPLDVYWLYSPGSGPGGPGAGGIATHPAPSALAARAQLAVAWAAAYWFAVAATVALPLMQVREPCNALPRTSAAPQPSPKPRLTAMRVAGILHELRVDVCAPAARRGARHGAILRLCARCRCTWHLRAACEWSPCSFGVARVGRRCGQPLRLVWRNCAAGVWPCGRAALDVARGERSVACPQLSKASRPRRCRRREGRG